MNPVYKSFIPEFPLLHLRKSKITTLCSAYKQAGLTEILKYMTDNEKETDILKIIGIEKIDKATRNIKRPSMALHTACMIEFIKTLKTEMDVKRILQLLQGKANRNHFGDLKAIYSEFLSYGCERNATFQLHVDLMSHADEIFSVYIAERIGGKDGITYYCQQLSSLHPFHF